MHSQIQKHSISSNVQHNTIKSKLPKLKSHSTHSQLPVSLIQNRKKYNESQTKTKKSQYSRIKSTHFSQKQSQLNAHNYSAVKYQYLNKSPGYFRKKEYLSLLENRNFGKNNKGTLDDNKPVESYVQDQRKLFQKKGLLDLLNIKIKKKAKSISHKNFTQIGFPHEAQSVAQLSESKIQTVKNRFQTLTNSNIDKMRQVKNRSTYGNTSINEHQRSLQKQKIAKKGDNYRGNFQSIEQYPSKQIQQNLLYKSIELSDMDYTNDFHPNQIQVLKTNIKKKARLQHLKIK